MSCLKLATCLPKLFLSARTSAAPRLSWSIGCSRSVTSRERSDGAGAASPARAGRF
ncbi:MAG: hypothetical protein MZU95_05845 [Desulfomicrobium escambiense]|nr:hypothetical protein [Desulfomicrobium escambiense]